MRKGLGILAILASVALVVPSSAHQSPTNSSFVTGYTPQNITFKPMNIANNVKPVNINQAMTPQSMGPKVFDISSVFSKISLPSPTPTRPTGNALIRPNAKNLVPGLPKPPTKKS